VLVVFPQRHGKNDRGSSEGKVIETITFHSARMIDPPQIR
jgi:hypothetical protein